MRLREKMQAFIAIEARNSERGIALSFSAPQGKLGSEHAPFRGLIVRPMMTVCLAQGVLQGNCRQRHGRSGIGGCELLTYLGAR